jgi:Pre-toxin TG
MSAPPDFELPAVEAPFEVQPLDPPPPTPEQIQAELSRQREEDDEKNAEVASGIVTLIPFIGEGKGLIDSIRGEDLITGHHMSWWERTLNVASCLPVVHEAKGLLKVVGLIGHNAHRVNIVVHASHLKHALEKKYLEKHH